MASVLGAHQVMGMPAPVASGSTTSSANAAVTFNLEQVLVDIPGHPESTIRVKDVHTMMEKLPGAKDMDKMPAEQKKMFYMMLATELAKSKLYGLEGKKQRIDQDPKVIKQIEEAKEVIVRKAVEEQQISQAMEALKNPELMEREMAKHANELALECAILKTETADQAMKIKAAMAAPQANFELITQKAGFVGNRGAQVMPLMQKDLPKELLVLKGVAAGTTITLPLEKNTPSGPHFVIHVKSKIRLSDPKMRERMLNIVLTEFRKQTQKSLVQKLITAFKPKVYDVDGKVQDANVIVDFRDTLMKQMQAAGK